MTPAERFALVAAIKSEWVPVYNRNGKQGSGPIAKALQEQFNISERSFNFYARKAIGKPKYGGPPRKQDHRDCPRQFKGRQPLVIAQKKVFVGPKMAPGITLKQLMGRR